MTVLLPDSFGNVIYVKITFVYVMACSAEDRYANEVNTRKWAKTVRDFMVVNSVMSALHVFAKSVVGMI